MEGSSRLAVARVAAGFRGPDRRERWSLRFDGDSYGFPSCAMLQMSCPPFAPRLCRGNRAEAEEIFRLVVLVFFERSISALSSRKVDRKCNNSHIQQKRRTNKA
jgi:hypothetical protein